MIYFERPVGLFLALFLILNVCRAAVVRSSEQFDKTAFVGLGVELRCALTDSHGHNLYWQKLKGRMSDDSFDMNGVLTLNKVNLEDDGFYECVSTQDQSADRVHLTVVPSSSSHRSINPKYKQNVEKNVHESAVLFCEFTNEPKLNWRKVHGSLPRFKTIYGEPDNRLYLHQLSEADSGDYECYLPDGSSSKVHLKVKRQVDKFVSNELDDSYFGFYDVELATTVPSPSFDSRAKKSLKQSVDASLYSRVELICSLDTASKDQIQWRKITGSLPIDGYSYHEKYLIMNINEEDFGTYECSLPDGRNELIQLNKQPELNNNSRFEVDPELEADVPMAELMANFGQDAYLTCQPASPSEHVNWERLDFELTNERVFNDGINLVINHVYPSDSGVYQCTYGNGEKFRIKLHVQEDESTQPSYATTSVGYPTASNEYYDYFAITEPSYTQEFVSNHEPHLNIKSNFLTVKEGDLIENLCSFNSSNLHELVIEWFNQNGEPVENNDRFQVYVEQSDSLTSLLRIYPAKREDTGRYQCRIQNPPQSIEFELQVQEQYSNPEATSDYYYRPETEDPVYPHYPDTTSDYYYRPETEHSVYPQYPDTTSDYYYRPETEDPVYPHYPDTTSDYYYRPETERPSFQLCDVHEATCGNGQCIPRSALCDGKFDCADGTDENCDSSSYGNSCQPNEKACKSGGCVQKIWLCDGENDCKDGSDENNCPTYNYGEMCRPTEFQCSNRVQCVSKGFLCDKTTDCTDNSDEIGCVKPSIVQNPVRHITVRIGATFQIECRAAGFPTPFINWRLNWGHVCEEPRCNITNNNGIGILIVSDVRITDAGAYSCEAINANGREFAVPDTFVEVINDPVPTTRRTTTTTTTTTRATYPTTTPRTTTTTTTTTSYDDFKDLGCNCHNHAEQCTCSGKCYNCQHNTYGDKCQYCLPGYYGDATRGTPFDCSLYPITTTTSTTTVRPTTTTIVYVRPIEREDCHCNGHSYECTCSGYCLNCQHNTEGKYCNQCKPGYEGDPLSPQGCHKRIGFLNDRVTQSWATCNPYGTAQENGGSCICKSNVIGKYCDQCAAHSFNLVTNHDYRRGCLSCFCNGLEVECQSSNLVYETLRADFETESHDWSIGDKFTKNVRNLDFANGGLEYSDFSIFQDNEAFFIVPDKFKGNRLSSYGGNITIKLKFSSLSKKSSKFELRMSGSHVNIVYLSKDNLIPDFENEIVVPLYEDEFKRYGDNGKVNREHMLMALSDLKLIMIRANYSPEQYLIHLSEFGLDEAKQSDFDSSENRMAKSVEVCECPFGYSGNSCENCAQGFKRSISGFYLGLCEPKY